MMKILYMKKIHFKHIPLLYNNFFLFLLFHIKKLNLYDVNLIISYKEIKFI